MLATVASLSGAALMGWGLLGGDGAAAGLPAWLGGEPAVRPTAADPLVQARLQREQVARQQREQRARTLTAALDAYAKTAPEFALAVVDHRTGQTYTYQGDRPFEMASIVKVSILAALLLQAQDEQRELTDEERSLAGNMIRSSNNEAATALYERIGEVRGLTEANQRFGLRNTKADPSWGLTRTTAADQARLLTAVLNPKGPLNAESLAFLRELMGSVAPAQRWGVSAAAKGAERTVLKNGWLPRSTENNRYIINSLGRITGDRSDASVVVLSHGHPTFQSGIEEAERIAALARRNLAW